jgi:hypothetical protein
VLFKINVIQYSPYLIYLFVSYGITLKAIYELILLIKDKTQVNKLLFVMYFVLLIIIDIVPIYLLEPNYSKSSIIFTLILLLLYCIIMELQNKNIINQYIQTIFSKLNKKIKNMYNDFFTKII